MEYGKCDSLAVLCGGSFSLGRFIVGLVSYRHTAIVVHGKEFFFSGEGINSCAPVRISLLLSSNTNHISPFPHLSCSMNVFGK